MGAGGGGTQRQKTPYSVYVLMGENSAGKFLASSSPGTNGKKRGRK